MADFAPLHARLGWANGHIERLRALVAAYTAFPPFSQTVRRDPDGRTVERADINREPPIEISLALSDAAHQLRATLDNMVGALRLGGPSEVSAFPITADPTKFAELARSQLDGAPDWAVEEIRRHEPFAENTLRWIGEEFQALHELARRDRHRALALHAAVVEPNRAEFQMQDTEVPIEFRQEGPRAAEIVYDGRTAVRAVFGASVQLAEPAALLYGHDVVPMIDGIYQRVRYLVALIEQLAAKQATGE